MKLLILVTSLTALLAISTAQDENAILDECEKVGFRAGGFAMRAACAIMVSRCPVPIIDDEEDFDSRSALSDGLLTPIIRDTCQILFKTSCVSATISAAYAKGGDCVTILDHGPDLEFPEAKCSDHDAAIKLFTDTAEALCDKSVPDIKPAPPAKKEDLVRFSARGSTGVEFLGGIQIVGENRLSRVLPVKCGESKTGQLTTFSQECTAAIPSEVKHNDVRELKLIFSNPHAPLGEDDRNVFIDAGTVWFGGKNIWRSAVDTTVRVVLENDGGRLDALRLGRIYWAEGSILNPPSEHPIWFEAKGETGEEVLTINVEMNDGSKQLIPIQCRTTNDGKLLKTFQVCTGQFNGNRKDAKRILIDFNYKRGRLLNEDRKVNFRRGRISFFGVNVLWVAENPKISLAEVWRLRAGSMRRSGNTALVNHDEYKDE